MKKIITKKIFFILIALCFINQSVFGQKTEINFNAYSGLFSFRGNGSASNSWMNFSFYTFPSSSTFNPYGKKNGFSYALELQGQNLTKRKNIYGSGISFEILTSKVNIDTVAGGDPAYLQYPATGKTTLKNTFITLNPFVGHRYINGKITFDLLTGIDLSFCLKSREAGTATTNNNALITVENDKDKPSVDFRPRVQIKTQYKKIGFLLGYSLGLTNYQNKYSDKAYTSFLRLGISCQIK